MDPNSDNDELIILQSREEQIGKVKGMLEKARQDSADYHLSIIRRKQHDQKLKEMKTGAQIATGLHVLYMCRRKTRRVKQTFETSLQQLKESLQRAQTSVSTDCQRYMELYDDLVRSEQKYPMDENSDSNKIVYRC